VASLYNRGEFVY